MNKTLEEMAKTIFKRWFIDFEFPNEEGKPYKSSGGEFINSELGEIPKGWRVGKLEEIIQITSGKRPKERKETKDENFKIPLIGASSIMGYVNEVLYNEPLLIIGRVGTHGIVQRVNYPCWISDNAFVIKSRFKEFVYQILKIIDYESLNRGTTQPLITQRDLKNYKLILPDDYVLNTFENKISTIFKKIEHNQKEIQTLIKIRDTLLPKLITGKIRVKT
jgi:type I restriction enzyme S subunit